MALPFDAMPPNILLDIVGNIFFPYSTRNSCAQILSGKSIAQKAVWNNYFLAWNTALEGIAPDAPIHGMIKNRLAEDPSLAQFFSSY
jgi:hypothetical protein